MSKPSAILSKIAVPHFDFPGLALCERDFRFYDSAVLDFEITIFLLLDLIFVSITAHYQCLVLYQYITLNYSIDNWMR